jgi:hypothetical protein
LRGSILYIFSFFVAVQQQRKRISSETSVSYLLVFEQAAQSASQNAFNRKSEEDGKNIP